MRPETKHIAVLVGGTALTALLSMGYSVYAGRVLGPEAYADFSAAISLVALCHIALGLINGTVARFTAQYAGQGEYGKILTLSREVTRRVALYGLAGAVAALAVLKPLADLLQFASVLPLVVSCAALYLTLLLSAARGVLRGTQRFGPYAVNIVLESATRLGAGVVLLTWICGVTSGLSAYLVGLVVVLVVSRFQLRSVWRGYAPKRLDGAAVRRFTLPMLVMMCTSAGFQNIDMLFVKRYLLEADAGVYGAAFTLARTMNVLVTPFNLLLLPLLTSLHEQGRRIAGTFARICGHFLLLAAAPLALFWLYADEIIVSLYGGTFAAAAPVLLPLAAARLVGFLSYMFALVGASANRFGFLVVYVPGVAAEVLALQLWHESTLTVALVVLAVQTLTLVAMAMYMVLSARRGGLQSRNGLFQS